MATADPNITNLFTCPVCIENFKDPRILPACGHHFCMTCLEGIARLHPQGAVTCPTCRAVTDIKHGSSVANLPRPVVINELQQMLLSRKTKDTDISGNTMDTTQHIMDGPTDQDNIAKLDEVQIARIQSLEQAFPVIITIERLTKIKRICVHGTAENISSVVGQIYAIFMQNTRKENEKGELPNKKVQWYYADGPGMEEYPGEINSKIEQAFDSGKTEVEWTEADGEKFKIDFRAMVEIPVGRAGANVRVKRSQAGLPNTQAHFKVQWYFEDGPDMETYPEEIHFKIEEAFDSGRTEVEWTEADGEKFKIDFKAMVEIQNGNAGASVKVHRIV